MNQSKCISEVIKRYADFPSVQADIRRVIGYIESFHRMALTPFIKGTEKEQPVSKEECSARFMAELDAPFLELYQTIEALAAPLPDDDAELSLAYGDLIVAMIKDFRKPGTAVKVAEIINRQDAAAKPVFLAAAEALLAFRKDHYLPALARSRS